MAQFKVTLTIPDPLANGSSGVRRGARERVRSLVMRRIRDQPLATFRSVRMTRMKRV